jgi:hypothetical protein
MESNLWLIVVPDFILREMFVDRGLAQRPSHTLFVWEFVLRHTLLSLPSEGRPCMSRAPSIPTSAIWDACAASARAAP